MPCKVRIKKSRLPTSNIQWHRIYITIPRWWNMAIGRKYYTKLRWELSRSNSKSCNFMSDVKGLHWLYSSSFSSCNLFLCLSWTSSTACLLQSLWDISGLHHLQHLWISNTMEASLSQLCTMISHDLLPSRGLHAGTTLKHGPWACNMFPGFSGSP